MRRLKIDGAVAALVAVAAAYLLGARGLSIVWVAALLWFPSILAVGSVLLRCCPPKLVPWDGRKIA